MYRDLLPIGSIVTLKDVDEEAKFMTIGRLAVKNGGGDDTIYDYMAVPYPTGLEDNELYFFNRDDISRTYFIGYQDQDELNFRSEFLDQLGELMVYNGEIVERASVEGGELPYDGEIDPKEV